MLLADLDAVFLSRIQFAVTVGYHYLFPPLTIGLGLLMVIMEGAFIRTGDYLYESMAKFWTRIFAIIFAMGVATGIVMEFQFGTNWATYSRFVGDVFGSALAAEGIFAFFLESGFLAVLVFGWDRVSPAMHFFSTCMVSLGSIFSAVWILIANSWQQTPAGYHLVGEGLLRRAEVLDFWQVLFNPSTVERLTHTLIGAFLAGGFLVISVSAYYLLKGRHTEFARRCLTIALPFTFANTVLIALTGHQNGVMIAEHQPWKLAAMEGHFKTEPGGTPLYMFGIPDVEGRRVHGVAIPGGLSFLVHGDFTTPVTALDDPNIIPNQDGERDRFLASGGRIEDYWPPIHITFQSFHGMVALGMLMMALSGLGCLLLWRGALERQRWLLRIFVIAIAFPMLANELGWIATEVGRQPWIVSGLLKTSEAASKSVNAAEVLASITIFGLIYVLLFFVWIYVLDHKIKDGPEPPEALAEAAQRRREGWIRTSADRVDKQASMTEPEKEERRD